MECIYCGYPFTKKDNVDFSCKQSILLNKRHTKLMILDPNDRSPAARAIRIMEIEKKIESENHEDSELKMELTALLSTKEKNFEIALDNDQVRAFVPGVDKGLREWLIMRRQLQEAKSKGSMTVIPKRIKYIYNHFWKNLIPICTDLIEDTRNQLNNSMDFNFFEQENYRVSDSSVNHQEIMLLRHERGLRHLLNDGFDVNSRICRTGKTMLHIACFDGDINKVSLLLEAKANVDALDDKHRTPLMIAINQPKIFNQMKIIRLLLSKRASVNLSDDRGSTPLHAACILADVSIITALLQKKAQVSAQDKNGKFAIEYTNVSIA